MVNGIDGPVTLMLGAVLSTVKVPLGPAAGALFPAASMAVPAGIEIPSEPSPVMDESVTVQAVPAPLTATVALAVPEVFKMMFPALKVLAPKFASV